MALWNYTIFDTSPMFSYHPFVDGYGIENSWQTYYSVSQLNKQPGDTPRGDSYHVTTLPDAELSLEFYGSAVYLYGTMNASYEVILDNDVESFIGNTGLIYSKQDLVEQSHHLTLKPKDSHVSYLMGFGRAEVTTSDQKMPTQVFRDNSDSIFSYSGHWTTDAVQGIPNSSVTSPFHQTLDYGASVIMNFSRAGAIALYGTTNYSNGLYSVSLDNEDPKIYNGSTLWLAANTLLFHQCGLDPERTHYLNITNQSGGSKLMISSAIIYEIHSGSTTLSSSHLAKIVKITAPIAGVGLIGVLLVVLWRVRSRKSRINLAATITPWIPSEVTNQRNDLDRINSETDLIPRPRKRQRATVSPPSHRAALRGGLPSSDRAAQLRCPAVSSTNGAPDVEQIIELIAQRIDRRDRTEQNAEMSGGLPPGYRADLL
ncbi:hypothetical protein R3P38DRAFT_2957713 [Favolaschia claudopus]|uniref:Uncharacterized protein n=1 Tax=Favolaschia claudopus TaxID=2862362 RepID=A0AAW0BD42_9AGAR